jgi:triacylglycerol lipase
MKCLAQALLPLLFVASLFAGDAPFRPGVGAARTSEFDPEKEDDTLFVVDDGQGLDSGCTYRSGGPLIIHVPIRRYVGPVNADGTLQNPDALVAAGVLSATAHLRMPVYDVDTAGDPTDPSVPPERDIIKFNGEAIGELSGVTDRWKHNDFSIPIRLLKFAAFNGPPADNIIRIDIDQLSATNAWCTSVDWAELRFDAVAPVFLVHGLFSEGIQWEPDFPNALRSHQIPYSLDIDLPGTGSIVGNGRILGSILQREADQFGARKCHIIAHSKGGLDTRAYLNDAYDEEQLKVLSVHTVSTPHRGTPVADFYLLLGAVLTDNSPLFNLARALMPAFDDLTTWSVARFNSSYHSVPGGIQFASFGADADLNHDGFVSLAEAQGVPFAALGPFNYQLIGIGEQALVITVTPGSWGDFTFPSIDFSITPFVKNDTLVSELSAHAGTYLGTLPANHVTVKSRILAEVIIDRIKNSTAGLAHGAPTPIVNATDQQAVAPTAVIRDFFQLTPANRTRTFNVTIDAAQSISFFTLAASRTLTITATAPGGATFPLTLVPLEGNGTTGGGYFATVANPIPGLWSIGVTESAQLAAPLDVVSTVQLSSPVQSVLVGGGVTYPLGGKVRLALVVFDGTRRLTGLTIAALLLQPSSASFAPLPITFRDDGTDADTKAGDGIYEAFVTPPAAGEFAVRVEAVGTASTGAFRRSTAAKLTVVARDAEITDVDDDGEDDDFDGLYDRIVVTPYATLTTAGNYEVFARLRASNGREIQRSVEITLPAGNVHADIPFTAEAIIRDLGVDGPYTIAELRYSRIIGEEPVPADIRYNVGATSSYDLDDLQHRRVTLTGTAAARGINTDADVDFEQLEVTLGVLVENAGTYTWSVTLRDFRGREITFIAGQQNFSKGTNTLRLLFPAAAISKHGVNGPWTVTNLAMYGAGQSLVVNDVFTTPAFLVADFGPAPRRRSTRH